MKSFENLSNNQRALTRISLQAIVAVLTVIGVLDTFWGGLISGVLFALILNELLMHWQLQKQKRNTKSHVHL